MCSELIFLEQAKPTRQIQISYSQWVVSTHTFAARLLINSDSILTFSISFTDNFEVSIPGLRS